MTGWLLDIHALLWMSFNPDRENGRPLSYARIGGIHQKLFGVLDKLLLPAIP